MTVTESNSVPLNVAELHSGDTCYEFTTPIRPEQRLMLAVLQGAISDFQAYASASTARGKRFFMEADAWLRSSTDRPFAFENICQATGLDPSFIRAGLRRWYVARRRKNASMAPVFRSQANLELGIDPRRTEHPLVVST